MDLKTTAQQDFVAFKQEKTKSAKYLRKENLDLLKFAGVSNYQSEYPNWGHYEFINIGNFKRAYGANNVKLSPITTYTQNFCKDMKTQRTQSQKKLQVSNPLTACGDFFGMTTSRDAFKMFRKDNFPERVKNKELGILQLESPKAFYKTMYIRVIVS
jgi:hypothetical protein